MWVRVRVRVLLTCCSCAHSPYIYTHLCISLWIFSCD